MNNVTLPREAILEYQVLYQKQYGKAISYEEALTQGEKLLGLFHAIYRPIQKAWINEKQRIKITKKGKESI